MTRERSLDEKSLQSRVTFENAKEATRRAVFLNLAAKMSSDPDLRKDLKRIFRLCRSAAIAAGAAMGHTEAQIDAELSELCDADVRRLKVASAKEFTDFAEEAREIVNRFIAASDIS